MNGRKQSNSKSLAREASVWQFSIFLSIPFLSKGSRFSITIQIVYDFRIEEAKPVTLILEFGLIS